MIFQHTYQQVLDGTKTQTRRISLPESDGTGTFPFEIRRFPNGILAVVRYNPKTGHYRIKWQVGRSYSVQPGRGQKAVARIRVTGIRREDVRQISIDDVRREGFRSKYEFLETWTMMHDKAAYNARPDGTWLGVPLAQQQKTWRDWLQGQITEHYQAWVLEFELVREAVSA